MPILRAINLGIRFLLELASLAVFGYWGFTAHLAFGWRMILAIALPLAAASVWGLFISPRARFRSGRHGEASLGLVVFLAAALALSARGHHHLALAFAATSTLSSVLLYLPSR